MGGEPKILITRLEPVHDPEAYQSALHTLGIGLRRSLSKLCHAQAMAARQQPDVQEEQVSK